jgi:hypothetical protein
MGLAPGGGVASAGPASGRDGALGPVNGIGFAPAGSELGALGVAASDRGRGTA